MLKSARKQERDPEGRMPLADHLRELRNRLAKGVLAIVVVTIVAAFFYQHIINFITEPLLRSVGCSGSFGELAKTKNVHCAHLTVSGLLTPFTLALKASLTAGVVLASPIWLYQLWAFVAPGLHRHEKKYAYAFVGFGVPLFLGGGYLAYHVLPTTAKVMIDLTPKGAENLLPLDNMLDLVTRMIVVFGLAFEMPLLLVMLNLTGILSGRRMLGWWRAMVVGIAAFAAVATPGADPISMLALATPIWALFFIAVGFSLLNDRRRARLAGKGPADDEASELDLTPESIEEPEAIPASRSVTDQVNGYDDIT
ncbi:twin-arginine translocase subunit TatC [Streptomyces sp. FXJ1.172]|uniref:twin-arginine translocase subunit TatC n=1 Tax=Streptomyces sp. FXJ1.172 TaxID=710705 RepID=UPI0023DD0DE7|nr:twin-arginine translocase subunit TatC [Streptomyces sp. FXJ1.172]WEO98434.1 twin-arginine translocase subunit TatC [Streptomyces sp. FXJ1.172]